MKYLIQLLLSTVIVSAHATSSLCPLELMPNQHKKLNLKLKEMVLSSQSNSSSPGHLSPRAEAQAFDIRAELLKSPDNQALVMMYNANILELALGNANKSRWNSIMPFTKINYQIEPNKLIDLLILDSNQASILNLTQKLLELTNISSNKELFKFAPNITNRFQLEVFLYGLVSHVSIPRYYDVAISVQNSFQVEAFKMGINRGLTSSKNELFYFMEAVNIYNASQLEAFRIGLSKQYLESEFFNRAISVKDPKSLQQFLQIMQLNERDQTQYNIPFAEQDHSRTR